MRARIDDDDDDVAAVRPGCEPALRRAHALIRADEVRLHEVEEPVAVARFVRPAAAAVRNERVNRPFASAAAAKAASTFAPSRMSTAADERAADLRRGFLERFLAARKRLRRAPSRARRSAIALPIPRPAPVTTTCRSFTARA